MYNNLVLFCWFGGINGGLYDAIEYSYLLNTISNSLLLIIIEKTYESKPVSTIEETEEKIKKTINYKYKFSYNDLNIQYINKNDVVSYLIRHKFNSSLFIEAACLNYLTMTIANKKIVLADNFKPSLHFFNDIKKSKFIKVFNEIPDFPSSVNYKFKFLFDQYKTYDYLEDNTLVSYKGNMNNKLHNTKFINNKTGEEIKFDWPIDNFNQKFNRYEVYSLPDWFDPRPRIYVECLFYGISLDNIVRHIDKENYDGAYYRLKDLKDNGLNNRYLTTNDEVIQEMTNE